MRASMGALMLVILVGCGGGETTAHADTSKDEARAVYDLAADGEVEKLRELLAENPGLANARVLRGHPILEIVVDMRPAFKNMHATIEVLLQAGADPNEDAPEILRIAIWRGDPESFELLLEYGADPLVVSPKKKMNMLEYAGTKGDQRFDDIVEAWRAEHR